MTQHQNVHISKDLAASHNVKNYTIFIFLFFTAIAKYMCETCGKMFKTKGGILAHRYQHFGKSRAFN